MKSSGIWVYVVGILMFVWGFCQLGYAFMGFDLPITIPYTEWGTLLGEEELFEDMQLGLAFGCMLTGIGLLIFRAWARVFTIWIVWIKTNWVGLFVKKFVVCSAKPSIHTRIMDIPRILFCNNTHLYSICSFWHGIHLSCPKWN